MPKPITRALSFEPSPDASPSSDTEKRQVVINLPDTPVPAEGLTVPFRVPPELQVEKVYLITRSAPPPTTGETQ